MTRILVVEDEPDIQELLCAYLRESGYEVEQALDGVEALDKFRRGIQAEFSSSNLWII